MAQHHSPRIVTDGLVFYYDMYNPRSWIGRPTRNLLSNSYNTGGVVLNTWSVDSSGYSTAGTKTIDDEYDSQFGNISSSAAVTPTGVKIVDSASNTRLSNWISNNYDPSNPIQPNTQYTFSVKYKRIVGTPTLRFQIQAYDSEGGTYLSTIAFPTTSQIGIVDTAGWQTAKYTVTTPSGCYAIKWYIQDGDDYTGYTHTFKLKQPQVEAGSAASPYDNTGRTAEYSILDISKENKVISRDGILYNYDSYYSYYSYVYFTTRGGTGIPVGSTVSGTFIPGGTVVTATYDSYVNINENHTAEMYGVYIPVTFIPSDATVITPLGLTYNSDGTFSFSGSSSYIKWTSPYMSYFPGITVEAWVNMNVSGSSWVRIFDFGAGQNQDNILLCQSSSTHELAFYIIVGSTQYSLVTTTTAIVDSTNTHFVATADGVYWRIYKNGVEIASVARSVLPANVTRSSNYIGKSNWATDTYYLNGNVPNAKIYNRALSAAEVLQNFNAHRGKYGL